MKNKNNILLISEDEDFAKVLASKIIFLRFNDNIVISNFEKALNSIEICVPNIILLHGKPDNLTYNLLKEIHKDQSIYVILISDSNDPDFILSAYDLGADDFILSSAEDFEFVLRIVHNIKNNSVKLQHLRDLKILEQLNVIEAETGIYNYSFAKQVVENYIDYNLLDFGSFIAISPAESSKMTFDIHQMAKIIKNNIRVDDIVTLGKGLRFYILLPNIDMNQALVVFKKIQSCCNNQDFEICAGITSITNKNFDEIECNALEALSNAITGGIEYAFLKENESTLDEWLDDEDLPSKGYKIFKQIFNKKLEKVITPVFFRLQKTYEEKFLDTEIEQYTNDEQCVFKLSNKNQESTLKIVYPGFAKIVIYITHEGLDSPENREIQISLTKITQKELVNIVEDFIKEFSKASV